MKNKTLNKIYAIISNVVCQKYKEFWNKLKFDLFINTYLLNFLFIIKKNIANVGKTKVGKKFFQLLQ